MNLKLFLALLSTLFSLNIYAQTPEHTQISSDEHDHHKNEIGVANMPVYFLNEKELAYGLHFHYTRKIKNTKFGFGLGYERIFDEHKHNTLGIATSFRPTKKLSFNITPGLTFEDKNPHAAFALHIETAYEFEVKDFHIGPLLELAYDPEDYHISLGFHIGYGF